MRSSGKADAEFAFSFDAAYVLPARAFGISRDTSGVWVTTDAIAASFGPWSIRTPRSNIESASLTGPYRFARTAGPAHLSFSDRGLTFASNGRLGVCLTFVEPIRGIDPFGWIRHPNVTLTVASPEELAELLESE